MLVFCHHQSGIDAVEERLLKIARDGRGDDGRRAGKKARGGEGGPKGGRAEGREGRRMPPAHREGINRSKPVQAASTAAYGASTMLPYCMGCSSSVVSVQ